MRKVLRPYQSNAVSESLKALDDYVGPVLLMASVGAGKSLMLAEITDKFDSVLCLVNSAELVRSNSQCYLDQGGECSIYCGSLNSHDYSSSTIFATYQSIMSAIRLNKGIALKRFDLIVIDECHLVNVKNSSSGYMRILNYFGMDNSDLKVLGATGTNYRFKNDPLVGEDCFFKIQVGNITTRWLIENKYLVPPRFSISREHVIDFSRCKVKSNGKFSGSDLSLVISESARETEKIMVQLVHVMKMEERSGCFIFASTIKHCFECLEHLPADESAVITGSTPQEDREIALDRARKGSIKYLINVAVLTVGIDIPLFDTVLYVRPTESMVLMVQTMGRGLRLYPNKKEALIIDCAGNIDRHSDWDDPIIEDALDAMKKEQEAEYIYPCPACLTLNKLTSRRCINFVDSVRCDHYFEFKECCVCNEKNDITSRECRGCGRQLINPNDKLNLKNAQRKSLRKIIVNSMSYTYKNRFLKVFYDTRAGRYSESFSLFSKKGMKIFYYSFVKKHVYKGGRYFMRSSDESMNSMMKEITLASHIFVDEFGNIKKKTFEGSD